MTGNTEATPSQEKKEVDTENVDKSKKDKEESTETEKKNSIFANLTKKAQVEEDKPVSSFNFGKYTNNDNLDKKESSAAKEVIKENDQKDKKLPESLEHFKDIESLLSFSSLKVFAINQDKKWALISQGQMIMHKLVEDKESNNIHFKIINPEIKNVLFNSRISNVKQKLNLISGDTCSRFLIAMVSTRKKDEKGKPKSELESFMLQGEKDKISVLVNFLNEYFNWDDEQNEIDEDFEKFLDDVDKKRANTKVDKDVISPQKKAKENVE